MCGWHGWEVGRGCRYHESLVGYSFRVAIPRPLRVGMRVQSSTSQSRRRRRRRCASTKIVVYVSCSLFQDFSLLRPQADDVSLRDVRARRDPE